MTIADLDVPPAPAGGSRRLMVPSRPVALVVIGLLILAVVTGSVQVASRVTGLLWAAGYDRDNDTVTVTPTTLYVAHQGKLTAFDLADGSTLWQQPAPAVMPAVPVVQSGVLVAPAAFERYFERPDLLLSRTTLTTARDARTGAPLWTAQGGVEDVTASSVLLLDDTGAVPQLRDVAIRDARTRWSRAAPGLANVVVAGDTVVTSTVDGTLTAMRYADGVPVRTEKAPGDARLAVAAGRLIVASQGPSGQTNTVYRADTLTRLWQAGGALSDCGPVVCGTAAGALAGYDPDTGAARWRVVGMTVAWPVGRDHDRIIAASELGGQFQLLDPSTGRALSVERNGIGTWRPVDRTTGPPADDAYLIRDENTLLRLDLGTGKIYSAGTIDGSGWLGCRNVPKYLVCLQGSRLVVTAVG